MRVVELIERKDGSLLLLLLLLQGQLSLRLGVIAGCGVGRRKQWVLLPRKIRVRRILRVRELQALGLLLELLLLLRIEEGWIVGGGGRGKAPQKVSCLGGLPLLLLLRVPIIWGLLLFLQQVKVLSLVLGRRWVRGKGGGCAHEEGVPGSGVFPNGRLWVAHDVEEDVLQVLLKLRGEHARDLSCFHEQLDLHEGLVKHREPGVVDNRWCRHALLLHLKGAALLLARGEVRGQEL